MAPDWDVIGYDPCIPGLDDPPEPADMLVCTDVLEHIEPEYLDDVMRDIRRLMLKAGFLAVDTVEAQKFLADGRNAHLTIEDGQWWLRRLMDYFHILQFEEHERKIIAAVK